MSLAKNHKHYRAALLYSPLSPPFLFQRLLWLHCFPPHQADKGFYVTANFVGTCRRQSNQLTQLQEAPPLPPPSLPFTPCCFRPGLTFVELSNLASHGAASQRKGRKALALTALLAHVEVTNFWPWQLKLLLSLFPTRCWQLKLEILETTLLTQLQWVEGGGKGCAYGSSL